jgi:DNA-binding response OmpR family regulator
MGSNAAAQSHICVGVVDDDRLMVRLLRQTLEKAGYRVASAGDGPSALDLVEREKPDLLVLDIVLPGMDGYGVLARLREFTGMPIMLLTGMDDDVARGLEAGADDYLCKPFAPGELVARVQAILRRAQFGPPVRSAPVFHNGDLTIEYANHVVTAAGRTIAVTPTEYRLLCCLAQHAGRVVLQDDVLREVWGEVYEGEHHLLRVNVSRLRVKLGEGADSARYVATKPGIGYMMPEIEGPVGSL